jgi:hypothetical protein
MVRARSLPGKPRGRGPGGPGASRRLRAARRCHQAKVRRSFLQGGFLVGHGAVGTAAGAAARRRAAPRRAAARRRAAAPRLHRSRRLRARQGVSDATSQDGAERCPGPATAERASDRPSGGTDRRSLPVALLRLAHALFVQRVVVRRHAGRHPHGREREHREHRERVHLSPPELPTSGGCKRRTARRVRVAHQLRRESSPGARNGLVGSLASGWSSRADPRPSQGVVDGQGRSGLPVGEAHPRSRRGSVGAPARRHPTARPHQVGSTQNVTGPICARASCRR